MKIVIKETGELIEPKLVKRVNGKDDKDVLPDILKNYFSFPETSDENEMYVLTKWEWEDIQDCMAEEIELFGFKSNQSIFVAHLDTPKAKQDFYATSGVSYEFFPF